MAFGRVKICVPAFLVSLTWSGPHNRRHGSTPTALCTQPGSGEGLSNTFAGPIKTTTVDCPTPPCESPMFREGSITLHPERGLTAAVFVGRVGRPLDCRRTRPLHPNLPGFETIAAAFERHRFNLADQFFSPMNLLRSGRHARGVEQIRGAVSNSWNVHFISISSCGLQLAMGTVDEGESSVLWAYNARRVLGLIMACKSPLIRLSERRPLSDPRRPVM